MKKFLTTIWLSLVMFLLTTSNSTFAITKSKYVLANKDLNQLTIEELLQYADSKNYNFEVIDYNLINKKELVEAIEVFDLIPDVIEFEDCNDNNTKMEERGLTDSLETNVTARKSYTVSGTSGEGYKCSIYIYFRYDLYKDAGQKYINKIHTYYTTKNSATSMNVSSYSQDKIYIDNSSSFSKGANVVGSGTYRVSLSGINMDRVVDFNTWFYPGDRM